MKLLILVAASSLLVVGCKPATVYVDRPVEVRIAVPVPCPEPAKLARPVIKRVNPAAKPEEVTEAALRAMIEVMSYAEQLEAQLNAYRPPEVKK